MSNFHLIYTRIHRLAWTAQWPLGWSLHRPAFSTWVKQSHITNHLWVLRPRSTIRLSRKIRSVATETQWRRAMKLWIVYEFLLSRTTETDSGSWPSAKARKAGGMKSTHIWHARRIIEEAIITVMATLSGRKEKKYTIGCTHNWLFVTRATNTLHQNGKQ